LRFFVQPLIRELQGLLPESSGLLSLSEAYNKKGEFRHFLKARVDWQNHSVDILNGQESFKISPLLTANAWVILTETQNEVAAHTSVNVVSAKLWPDHS
jgi:molybdopterin molybdotransferase